jgi:hypothetical protein
LTSARHASAPPAECDCARAPTSLTPLGTRTQVLHASARFRYSDPQDRGVSKCQVEAAQACAPERERAALTTSRQSDAASPGTTEVFAGLERADGLSSCTDADPVASRGPFPQRGDRGQGIVGTENRSKGRAASDTSHAPSPLSLPRLRSSSAARARAGFCGSPPTAVGPRTTALGGRSSLPIPPSGSWSSSKAAAASVVSDLCAIVGCSNQGGSSRAR